MRLHPPAIVIALALLLSPLRQAATAAAPPQSPTISSSPQTAIRPYGHISLAFSHDGSLLRLIGVSEDSAHQHVRAVTYSTRTGAVVHLFDLSPGTDLRSATTDASLAIVAYGDSTANGRLFRFETATGHLEDLPLRWYHPDDDLIANLSGDGHLVSVYGDDPNPAPVAKNDTDTNTDSNSDRDDDQENDMLVAVYNWSAKTLVARRTSRYIAAGGGFWGKVTADGAVSFENNRTGSKVVDLKTGRLMANFRPSSLRSPDGAFVLQLPNRSWDDSAPADVLILNGSTGQILGKLNLHPADAELNGEMNAAFCTPARRFVLARRDSVAVYALPSGELLSTLPVATWQDPSAPGNVPAAVACSSTGTSAAILANARLTLHNLK